MANLFSAYLKDVYVPQAITTVVENSFWFNQPWFEIVTNHPGPTINVMLKYGVTSNAEAYVDDAPMVASSSQESVRAYFDKDYFQDTQKVLGRVKAELANGGSHISIDPDKEAIAQGMQNLITVAQSTFLADLGAQCDSSTAYSDAALSRATYGIASIETGSIGTLCAADLTDAIEGLQDSTNGYVDTSDMVFLMAPNQHTNVCAIIGTAYNEISVDAGSASDVDLGMKHRVKTFSGVPLVQVPGMTNTELYLVRRSQLKIFYHTPIAVVEKGSEEWADQYLLTMGANLVLKDPKRCVKLTGISA